MSDEFNLLVKMEPSRKRPNPGDVFVVQPKEGLYCYGKVIRKFELSVNNLLIPPQAVNNQGWLKGYYQTIGNLDVTESVYWHTSFSKMYDEEGNEIDREPQVLALYAVSSYGSMGYKIDKALGFNRAE